MDAILGSLRFEQYGVLLGATLLAAAIASGAYTLLSVITATPDATLKMFEQDRRRRLRADSSLYRWFEPLIDEIEKIMSPLLRRSAPTLDRHLAVAREPSPWHAGDFMAVKAVEGAFIGTAAFALAAMGGLAIVGAVGGVLLAVGYTRMAPRSIAKRAALRLNRIRLRLPFAVDLIALTMEAGGGFQECLQTAVDENNGHPLAEELSEVLRQIELGRPRGDALENLANRLEDDDITELVFAINKGEQLGTPLSTILRDQAEQMRIKRSQRGEKAAAEAEVNIVFPGMLVMLACLLVVIAPIVLPAVLALL